MNTELRTELNADTAIFLAGHRGMVGSAIERRLRAGGYRNIITRPRAELDLLDKRAVDRFFGETPVEYVILAAARVGGIVANNTFPADFIYDNLVIQSNVIDGAHRAGVRRLLFLGSSCIYPKLAPQPIREDCLLTGLLEPTNEPYAIAKIAGIKLCESFNRQHGTHYRSLMPTNLYGPHDNFHISNSHVVPALIRKAHEAKLAGSNEMEVWGSGGVRRELLHVDDLADACLFSMRLPDERYEAATEPMQSHINVGTGTEVSIAELADKVCRAVGFTGRLRFNRDMPEGTPQKLLDVGKLASLGWQASISLDAGLASTYRWFLDHQEDLRR